MSYSGPPPNTPPPRDWHPAVVAQPAPARALPPQDHHRLDAAERAARQVTYAVGAAAGTLALVVACVLGGRVVF